MEEQRSIGRGEMVEDAPVANTTKDTIILTWWFARQLVAGNKVKSCSIDWEMETLLADYRSDDRDLSGGTRISLDQLR